MFSARSRFPRPADALFFALTAVWALGALWGVWRISGEGAEMDSDLRCYAQNMAGAAHREMFGADPLLNGETPANAFWNLENFLAGLLAPGDNYALGLYMAGALCFFAHYVAHYLLGRFLFGAPALACLLSLLMGVTVWFNFGTFWGPAFSDPTPRVFFAALWPLLTACSLVALDRPRLRPLVMLACGICIYVHAISALNVGAMLFMAFLLRGRGMRPAAHLANCGFGLCLFFIPVLFFLWPSLGQERVFTPEELSIFKEAFALRFREDHGDLPERLLSHVRFGSDTLLLFCGGLAGFIVTVVKGSGRQKKLASMYPGFLLGMALVVLFSWLEPKAAESLGRIPMGREFVRGVRFLAPLSWLMIVSAVACFWPRLRGSIRLLIVSGVIACVLLTNQDRWHTGAFYTFSQYTGLPAPMREQALQIQERAEHYRQALFAVARLVPPGSPVFGLNDDMALRYLALRPLAWSFKDGSSFLYNKDIGGTRHWLRLTALTEQGAEGWLEAWRLSEADWLLIERRQGMEMLERHGGIVWENRDWFVARRR
ncbi:MAG: translation initiation factor 2 [Desulfovibrio sp.]|jgi:hypothetical protein|nr:translation initiation factor 2 [Desulfovibrio sp.]